MGKLTLFNELTRVAAKEWAAKGLLVIPVGATEQHGPHLPVGTDTFAVETVSRRAAEAASDSIPVVVSPTLPFGSSQHHVPFGGTMSLSTEVYYRAVSDLVESLILGGWSRVLIVNGHGGNSELVQLVVRDLALKHPVNLAALSYWSPAWDALLGIGAHLPGRMPGHAGAFESSLVLALRPELIAEPRPSRPGDHTGDPKALAPRYRLEASGFWQGIDGYTDSPAAGTAEHGEEYLATVVEELRKVMIEFYETTKG
jgi:creatinine amidohydrolase